MNEDCSQELDAEAFRQVGSQSDCLDEHRLAAYVDQMALDIEREEIEQHLADCSRCSRVVAFLEQEDGEDVPAIPDHVIARAKRMANSHRPKHTTNWRWVAAAAVIVVAVAAAWSWLPTFEDRSIQPENGSINTRLTPGEIHHAPELLWPTDGSEVPSGSLTARWSAVPQALYYDLRLLTASGDLAFELQVDNTELTLPSSVQLEPGSRYFIRVEAVLAEGQSLASRHVMFIVVETP
jgi:hypothetical protein